MIKKKKNIYIVSAEFLPYIEFIHSFLQNRIKNDIVLKAKNPIIYENILKDIKNFSFKIKEFSAEELIEFFNKTEVCRKKFSYIKKQLIRQETAGYSSFSIGAVNRDFTELENNFYSYLDTVPAIEHYAPILTEKNILNLLIASRCYKLIIYFKLDAPELRKACLNISETKNSAAIIYKHDILPESTFELKKPSGTVININKKDSVYYNGDIFNKEKLKKGISIDVISEYNSIDVADSPDNKIQLVPGAPRKIYETYGDGYRKMTFNRDIHEGRAGASPYNKAYNKYFNEVLREHIKEPMLEPVEEKTRQKDMNIYKDIKTVIENKLKEKKVKNRIEDIIKLYIDLIAAQFSESVHNTDIIEKEFEYTKKYCVAKMLKNVKKYESIDKFLDDLINEKLNLLYIFERKLRIIKISLNL
jgi:hypothetical protein